MDKHTSYLRVSASPHIHTTDSITSIMLNVCIALVPALIASVILYGWRCLLVVLTTVAACVLFEYAWCRLRHTNQTVGNCSAIVTGLLLAFNLPPTIPLYMAVIGAFVAIIITKELFGGLGHNFANPAIVGRIVLSVSFASYMTNVTYTTPLIACDAITSATPLASAAADIPFLDLFLGTYGGTIGETCSLALLIGLVWLLVTHVIEITVPLTYVGTVAILSAVFGQDVVGQIFSGGLLLGAIFMATDYTTCPFTRKGKIIYGVGLGLITCLIRFWGNMSEGVSYAILLMNLLVPIINEHTRDVPTGGGKQKK